MMMIQSGKYLCHYVNIIREVSLLSREGNTIFFEIEKRTVIGQEENNKENKKATWKAHLIQVFFKISSGMVDFNRYWNIIMYEHKYIARYY